MKLLTLLIILTASTSTLAQKSNEAIQRGNTSYREKRFDQAKQEYELAIKESPGNETAQFNLASTVYKQGNEEEAYKSFVNLAKAGTDNSIRAKSYYNSGAILSKQKKLEESIEAYKNALRLDPNDKEARENLQKALLELKKKQPPKQKEQQKKQEKQQPQPKMSQREAEQRLKLLEQKEKEVQERLQKEKSKTGGSQTKDW
jgi:Ca-activated chloride channel family protein